MAWTDERVERLKKLWGDGLSASQIAKELGDVTRNAVIGKAHRLGLSGRPSPVRGERRAPRVRSQPAAPRPLSRPAPITARRAPEPIPEPDPTAGVSLLKVTEKMCKWPIGHPGEEDFQFCGNPSREDGPYCPYHAAKAYQPLQSKKDRRAGAA